MRQNITTFVVVAALTVALSARAGEFYAKNGISDWSVASNFTTDRAGTTDATTAPGESAGQDTVCILTGYTVNIASTPGEQACAHPSFQYHFKDHLHRSGE